jgi:signal transduction histidine kinase
MQSFKQIVKTMDIRKKILLILLAVYILTFLFSFPVLRPALLTLFAIQLLHLVFYTEKTKLFTMYAILVFGYIPFKESAFTEGYYFPFYLILLIFETFRVIIMAIVKYPINIQELKTLNEELEKRVKSRTAELEEANAKLRELDQMKTAFVQQASHDLRTPLAAIKGSLDNLQIGVAGELNEKQKRILDRATRSVDRLTALINDVLDLSRIESGRTKLEKTNVSLKTITENALQECCPGVEAKHLHFKSNLTDDPCFIYGDAGKIERVVNELLTNAVKYTAEGGTIQVDLQEQNGNASLTVQDSGIGLDRDECKKIFDRFYRTKDSQFLAKGSGLGLSIAKELLELHNGSIHVESEKGVGTCFLVTIPLCRQEHQLK